MLQLHVGYFLFWLILTGTAGIKITKLFIPKIIDVRESGILTCEFDLENGKLYSVKWYKNDLEFFRFMPNGNPIVQIFKVDGINLTDKDCNMTTVVLNRLEFTTSGLYTCEVSTEGPYFKTVQTSSNMTVLGIPEKNPTITGIENIYNVGDYVRGNCTSDLSYPVSNIDWYINDNKVESWQLEKYPVIIFNDKMIISTLGISFQVDHSHFSGKGNTMVLKCIANINDISRQTIHISKLADLDVEKLAQGLYGSYGLLLLL
ncbi:beat protein, putative [Pediculus humanus corporis]|uniref:Beat protein, putative n=1 Tax=Pediculus humanus subsp. corporis TaxID=121224 RepID=E0VIG4_PEDHC|nr:beat protein, putative [Pediculus humanus corporis]EEB13170.1 beat protein, putative [Pediculus humanus corporis]